MIPEPRLPAFVDEERREGSHPLDVEPLAGQLQSHRRTHIGRALPVDLAGEPSRAEDQLEIAEELVFSRQFDIGAEAGRGQAPDRLVDVARQPCGEAGGLTDGEQQIAVEAPFVFERQVAGGL